MRSSRYSRSAFGTKRTKKVRPAIRVRQRTAKKGGRCTGCRGRYEPGDPITVVQLKRRVFHTATCVPPNIDQLATLMGAGQSQSSARKLTSQQIVDSLSTNWTVGEATSVGLLAMENLLVVKIKSVGITAEMEKSFDRYNKLKGMVLRPGSDGEGRQATKLAMVELIKLVFSN